MQSTQQDQDSPPSPQSPDNPLTRGTYGDLATAFGWFNARLFGGALPDCLITFQRHRRARGFYWHDKFNSRRGRTPGSAKTPEIALNPDTFLGRKDRDVMSTLVHEMVHLWQASSGTVPSAGYHDREWAAKMVEVGLIPSATGKPGGKRTGRRMTHYVARRGPFVVAWGDLFHTGFRLRWQSRPASPDSARNKTKFTCPGCRLNVWGAPTLDGRLRCVGCRKVLVPAT